METASSALTQRISDVFRSRAAPQPNRPALCASATTWNYGALAWIVDDRLVGSGSRPGGRAPIAIEKSLPLRALVRAAAELDARAVVGSPRLSARHKRPGAMPASSPGDILKQKEA